MTRLITVILFCAGIFCLAAEPPVGQSHAQVPMTGAGLGKPASGGGGYTGPGDIVAATAWYGMRAYSAALASGGASTTKAIDVNGMTTTTSCTIFLNGTGTGGLDLTTAGAGGVGNQCLLGATTFCTVTNTACTVTKFYDQTGNGNNLSTFVAGVFPIFVFSALGSSPAVTLFNGAPTGITGTFAGKSQPWSIAMVIKTLTSTGTREQFSDSAFNGSFTQSSKPNVISVYAGTEVDVSALDSKFHSLSFRADDSGTGSAYSLDSAAATTGITVGTDAFGTTIQFGAAEGYFAEAGIWATLNNTQLKSVNDNAATFYGSFPQ